MDLGYRQAAGKLSTDGYNPYGNGNWSVTFDQDIFAVSTGAFEVYHIALTGPLGSLVQVWTDRTFYDITNHGDINSWDPNNPMELTGGKTLYFYWNTGLVPAPLVTIWMRQPALNNAAS
jgi:hypothetical protein